MVILRSIKVKKALFFLSLLITASTLSARPVSYPGGWTFITNNNAHFHMGNVHYSPTAKYSLGYQGEYWRKREYFSHFAMLNILVKRWNMEDSQANLYLKSGVGVAHSEHNLKGRNVAPTAFTGIGADWEDRRFFVSYENRFTEPGIHSFFQIHKARVGIAPYIGDMGDLHTWLMIQPEYVTKVKRNWGVTYLLRFFMGVDLVEVGVDNRGKFLGNWIHRF